MFIKHPIPDTFANNRSIETLFKNNRKEKP